MRNDISFCGKGHAMLVAGVEAPLVHLVSSQKHSVHFLALQIVSCLQGKLQNAAGT